MTTFPISGVETYWWLPALVAFVISLITSTSGISGAFILLPFQVSILGFSSPAVSPTNLLFNIIAIPGGIYRFIREKRMLWPLAITIIIGTAPGLIAGAYLRATLLADPRNFKMFVAVVLLYIAIRLAIDVLNRKADDMKEKSNSESFRVKSLGFSIWEISYEFNGEVYRVSTLIVFLLTAVVGIIGGAYGIGGGSIVAPFLVVVLGLPVYTVAGPALMGTFFTSIAGVFVYSHILPSVYPGQAPIYPDWYLGLSLGIGGFLGIYLGARLQKYLPSKIIKAILLVALLVVIMKYTIGFFSA